MSETPAPVPPASDAALLDPAAAASITSVARRARLVGSIGLAGCAVAWVITLLLRHRWPEGPGLFYKGYLVAWLLGAGVSLGAMALLMIHHLVGGEWGAFCRRPAEAAAGALPLLALLFLPVLIGIPHLYPWAGPHREQAIFVHRHAWMNGPAFALRSIAYLFVWSLIAGVLRRLSLDQDRQPSEATARKLVAVSAVGLIAYFLLMSFASIDWIMSLEPKWYSSIFGFLTCMGQGISGMAMLVITLVWLSRFEPLRPRIRPRHFNDLGTLLMMVVVLWAYNAFAQLLVIWMGNLQSEIPWYLRRSHGAWRWMAGLLIFLGFLAPFVLLLQRGLKQRGVALRVIACGLVVMRLIDLFWTVMPSGESLDPPVSLLGIAVTLAAVTGIGGVWTSVFLGRLARSPLIPVAAQLALDASHDDRDGKPVSEAGPEDDRSRAAAKPGLA